MKLRAQAVHPFKTLRRRSALALAALTALAGGLAAAPAGAVTVVWAGGTGNWDDAARWAGGASPNSAFVDVLIDNQPLLASAVNLNSYTSVGNLGINAGDSLQVGPGGYLAVYGGTLTNQGSLLIGGSSSGYAYLHLGSNTTLAGSGQTVLASDASGYYGQVLGNNHTLTIGAGHTLRGSGYLGGGDIALVNQGTLWADGPAALTVQMVSGPAFDNSAGLIKVGDGATLAVNGGTVSGGSITGLGRSVLGGSATFQNLALHGNLLLGAGGLTLRDVAISDSVTVQAGSSAYLAGTVTNTGTLTVAASNSGYSYLYLAGDTTLAGNGQTVLSSDASGSYSQVLGSNHTLTIGNGHTLRGNGYLGGHDLPIVNQGLLRAEGSQPLTISLGAGNSLDNRHGLIQVADGAALAVNSGTVSGGSIQGLGNSVLAGSATFQNLALTGNLLLGTGTPSLRDVSISHSVAIQPGNAAYLAGTITNVGTLTVAGSSSGYAYLYLADNTTLAGSGQTVLGMDPSGYYGQIIGSGYALTIGAGHTLRGNGYLGSGDLRIVNQGTLAAQGSQPLTVNLLGGNSFDNSAGLVSVADGAQLVLNTGTLRGGVVQGQGSASLSGSGVFKDTTLAGTLRVAPNTSVNLAGTITNTGSLAVGGNNNGYAYLSLSENTTLAGSGQTVLGADASGYYGQIFGNNHSLTIGTGHTLRGAGQLGSGDLDIVNQGTLLAEGPQALVIHPSSNGGINNTGGQIRIADGATLNVYTGTVSGGTLQGLGNSMLTGSATFQNLALTGNLLLGTGSLTLRDVSIHDTLTLQAGNSASLAGTITNTGTLTVAGSNTGYAYLYLADNTTLAGSGQTVLGADASGYYGQVFGSGHTLTIGAGHTLRGNGYLGGSDLNVVNQGTLRAQGSQPLYLNLLSGNSFDNSAGLVHVADGAALTLNNGTLWGGVVQGQGSASLGGSGVFKDTTLAGTLRVAPNTSANLAGTITNTGSLSVGGNNNGYAYLSLSENTTLAGAGQTVLGADASGYYGQVFGNNHTLTIGTGHTVRGSGYLGGNDLRIVNQGTLAAEGSQALTVSLLAGDSFDNSAGTVRVAQGGALVVNTGTLFGGVVQGQGSAAISGTGVLRDTTLTGTLRVAPNTSAYVAGTITNNGHLALGGSNTGYAHLFLAGDTTLAGSGQTVLGTDASGYYGQVVGSNHTLTLASGHTLRGAGLLGAGDLTVINQGLLIAEGGTLSANTALLDNSSGQIEVASDGRLALTGAGLALADGASLHFDISGLGDTQHGLISYSGNARFDGQLSLNFNDFSPQVGDSFTLLTFYGTGTGSFDSVQSNGWVLATHYNANDVTVTVMGAVPEPGSWALLLAGLVLGLPALRRRARRA